MGIHRKFLPIRDFPLYNDEVDRLIMGSSILNNDPGNISVHSTLWDRKNLAYYLAEKVGNEDGFVTLNGKRQLAMIPFVKGQLEQLEQTFAQYKKERINQGFKAVDLMPAHMLEEFYTLNARLTVLEMEADFLQKRLAEYKEVEDVESDSQVLKYGLRAFSKLKDGVIVLMDGQKCSETPEGIMIINDSRSRYSGMSVADYRDLCKIWLASRKAADRERLLQMQAEAIKNGEKPPQELPISSMHRANPVTFPAWPEGVRNYLIEKPHRIRTA